MNPLSFRLLLTSSLFLGWIGYLGYLVVTRPMTASGAPLVVSQPQIMASQIDIIADISDPQSEVTIVEVLYPSENAPLKPGDKVKIGLLADCKPVPRRPNEKVKPDWSATVQRYLVPLRRSPLEKEGYEVAPVPPSPGFQRSELTPLLRIYPDNRETRGQYAKISKPQ